MSKNKAVSIEPWITLDKGEQAAIFYKSASNATETYRLQDANGGLFVRLSVDGAGFWISSEPGHECIVNATSGPSSIRMILIVDNPEAFFAQAIKAGATEIFPVSEGHGWRICRVPDPFGLYWEIGHQLSK